MKIHVGKGSITVDSKGKALLSGKLLFLTLVSMKGPCNDVTCQVIRKIEAREGNFEEMPGMVRVEGEDFTVVMSREIFRSIDMGREVVSIRRSGRGNFSVKGFTYVS